MTAHDFHLSRPANAVLGAIAFGVCALFTVPVLVALIGPFIN